MSSPKFVLSLCDFTGVAVKPWANVGFECWIVDIKHPPGIGELCDGIRRVGADVTKFCPPLSREYSFVFAFPPCTDLAVSGARYFSTKGLASLADSIHIVDACRRICEAANCPYLIENPVGTLSTYWRKPDYTFHPHEYAGYLINTKSEAYTKKTCLWTGRGFVMPDKKPVEPILGSMIRNVPGSKRQKEIRSITPAGFSEAVFLANYQG